MKFKVGDKVRLKEDLKVGRMYEKIEYLTTMVKFEGEVGTINGSYRDEKYSVREFGPYYYSQEMLELVAESIADLDENTDEVVDTSVETIDKKRTKG